MWRVIVLATLIAPVAAAQPMDDLFIMHDDAQTRWASGENPSAGKGAGGTSNQGAKGAAFQPIRAGDSVTLMETEGAGVVHRMWITIRDRSPYMLRALRIDMYWDGTKTPAVSVPLGDFFGMVHGKMGELENEFFSSPEGKSFNASIPMPFRDGARITLTNESDRDVNLLFYDVDFSLRESLPDTALYFHAIWRRERYTQLEQDFEILPELDGRGKFLGTHVGVLEHPDNAGWWWGEGEVKMYLDGDSDLPTLVGTGTEDYIGTGWGQGEYQHRYQGVFVADDNAHVQSFYRYHVQDPVFFHERIRVTIQQLGGAPKQVVLGLMEKGVEVKPVSANWEDSEGVGHFDPLFDGNGPSDIREHDAPDDAWVNMWRRDDVCATAFFYLDRPENGLPSLASASARTEALPE